MSLHLAKSITSAAGRCHSHSPNLSHLPQEDVTPPRQIYHICHRKMSLHLAKSMTPAAAGVNSPSPHIRPPRRASIPHLQIYHICHRQMSIPHLHSWRGGDRQDGGEVYIHKKGHSKRAPKSPYISTTNRNKRNYIYFHYAIDSY